METTPQEATLPTVGIDVGGKRLDVAWSDGGRALQLAHDAAGIAALLAALAARPARLVVLEATGKLELGVADAVQAAGWPLHRANPRQVRDFARAAGILAKTDRLDARVLARFGAAMQPPPRPLPDRPTRELAETLARRGQLQELIAAEEQRLRRTEAEPVRRSIAAHLAFLRGELATCEAELARQVAERPAWRETAALLQSVPGVGPVLATTLLALLPELGAASPKEIAALGGVAPRNRDSGERQGPRRIQGGRPRVSAALYMATLSGCRCNPALQRFLARLLAAGKTQKQARVACAHKLLTILNAMVRSGEAWNPELALRC